MKRIVVTGGSGFVGRALLARLAARWPDTELVVPTRARARARAVALLPTVTLVEADLHDEAAVAGLVAGADALVHLVAILHGDDAAFERVHVALPRRLAAACRAAGVGRVVHVSALGVDAQPAPPSRYLRSKAAGEAAWRDAGLPALTILRPSVIFGAEDRLLNLFARLAACTPVVPLAAATARFQPVWVGDVAEAIARALLRQPPLPLVECAGPRVLTLAELVRDAARWAGHPRWILPLPEPLARLQAAVMARLPGEPLLTPDNLDSMRVPNVATGAHPGLDALGIVPASLDALAPGWLAPRRR